MAANIATRRIGDLVVEIDRDACSAFKACIEEAPTVFAMGDDQIVTFADAPDGTLADRILAACRACPVAALAVRDLSGKSLVP